MARHETPELTMNIYGRTSEERLWTVVEQVAQAIRVISVSRPESAITVDDTKALIYKKIQTTGRVEAAGIEPQDAAPSPHAPSHHRRAPRRHFRALRPSRASHDPSHDAPETQEQHTSVHDERAHSVHMDPDLAAVIAAWPTLAAPVRATILQLVATEEVVP